MLTPAEAEKSILAALAPFHREDCALAHVTGRVLREDVQADRDQPPFDRVTMDGFAVRAASIAAGIRRFQIEAVQAAGMRAFQLSANPDAAIEIMTGAVLSEGADCVVPYEETTRDGSSMMLTAAAVPFAAGHAIHRRGSDYRAKATVIPAGTRMTGREVAVAAACGRGTLTVSQVPRIAVIATGDELVEVEAQVGPHQVRRSNDHALRAALNMAGYPHVQRFHLRDVPSEIARELGRIFSEFDVVILCGGISKGKFDYLPAELDRLGVQKIFQGVAQRPGKPLWFGISQRQKPIFALPGNPVSAYTCLHRYVLPALAHASGLAPASTRPVALAQAVTFRPPLAYLLPVKITTGPGAESLATPDPSNTSGDFAGLLGTDGFVELPADAVEFPAGRLVPFRPWV